jgi:hypothetical protein
MTKKASLIKGLTTPDGKLAFPASMVFISLSLQRIACVRGRSLPTKQQSGIASRQVPDHPFETPVRKHDAFVTGNCAQRRMGQNEGRGQSQRGVG